MYGCGWAKSIIEREREGLRWRNPIVVVVLGKEAPTSRMRELSWDRAPKFELILSPTRVCAVCV